MDTVDKKTRSYIMSRVKGKNTTPEKLVRSFLHRLGYRFRIHFKKLPGHPDIVLPKYNAIILINGCFWHGHNCHLGTIPSTRKQFWKQKFKENRRRDKNNIKIYHNLGWRVLIIWECSLKGKNRIDIESLIQTTNNWLKSDNEFMEISGINLPNR